MSNLNRFSISIIFIISSIFIFSCKKNDIAKEKQIVLRFAESMNMEHPGAMASQYLADLVRTESNQRINIKIYFNGQLGNENEVIEQMQFAGIALSRVNMTSLLEKIQSFSSDFQKIMYTSPEEIRTYIQNNNEQLVFACQTEKLMPLALLYPDLRCFYSDTLKISTIDDIRDKRIGVADNATTQFAIKKYEGMPVTIISKDTYSSMSNGFINAQESALCDFIIGDEYPFINYVFITSYISFPDVFIMSTEVLNDFSKADRTLIANCAEKAEKYFFLQRQSFLDHHLPVMKKQKTVFERLTNENQ